MGQCTTQQKKSNKGNQRLYIQDSEFAVEYQIGTYFQRSSHEQRLAKWIKMNEVGLEKFARSQPKVFEGRIVKGPPSQFRWQAWQIYIESKPLQLAEQYKHLQLSAEKQVTADIGRTFKKLRYFAENQDPIFTVLTRYATYNPSIGYCQGMSVLAAIILLVSGGSEPGTFAFLHALLMKRDLQHFFSPQMPYSEASGYIVQRLLGKFFPRVEQHIESLEIGYESWVPQWLMTIYGYCEQFDAILHIWDNFIVHGVPYLFRVAVAVIKSLQSQILASKMENIVEILHRKENISLEVWELAKKVKFTQAKFVKYLKLYKDTKV